MGKYWRQHLDLEAAAPDDGGAAEAAKGTKKREILIYWANLIYSRPAKTNKARGGTVWAVVRAIDPAIISS